MLGNYHTKSIALPEGTLSIHTRNLSRRSGSHVRTYANRIMTLRKATPFVNDERSKDPESVNRSHGPLTVPV